MSSDQAVRVSTHAGKIALAQTLRGLDYKRKQSAACYVNTLNHPMLLLYLPGGRKIQTVNVPYSVKAPDVLTYLIHRGECVGFSIWLPRALTPGTHRVTECLHGLPEPFVRDIRDAFVPKHYEALSNMRFVVRPPTLL